MGYYSVSEVVETDDNADDDGYDDDDGGDDDPAAWLRLRGSFAAPGRRNAFFTRYSCQECLCDPHHTEQNEDGVYECVSVSDDAEYQCTCRDGYKGKDCTTHEHHTSFVTISLGLSLASGFIIAILLILIFFFYRRKRKLEQRRQKQRVMRERLLECFPSLEGVQDIFDDASAGT